VAEEEFVYVRVRARVGVGVGGVGGVKYSVTTYIMLQVYG